jgi:hypothetical protein
MEAAMISRISFGDITNRCAVLVGTLAIAAASLWAGGALSGENPRFDAAAEQLRLAGFHEKEDARQAKLGDAYLGRAPWICTPSGFGQVATCFERGDMRVSSND